MRTALLILLFLLSANFLYAQEPLFQFKSSIVPELGIRKITVDNDGYLYILQASKISKFKDGKLINNFHIDQSEYINSYIDAPTDIAVDNEKNFYLLNLNKRRIEKHDSAGKLIITFDIVDSFPEPDKVFLPWEISFDAEDNLYVYGFNRLIQVYNTEGNLIRTIDIPKLEAPNDDTGISHITLDTHGNFYILEEVKNTNGWYMLLNKYDNNGNHLKDLSTDPIKNKVSIANMAVDKNGDIYFTNRSFHNVDVYTPDGEYKHRINVEEGTNNWTKAIHFNIEFDQQNNVLLGGSNDHGSLFYAYNQNSILLYKLGDIRHPYEVAFDHENNILILDEVKKRVLKLGLDGKLISSINNLYVPKGLASD
ncbi:hypothetical protein ACSX1A_05010 [Pontibacter sp. MBLB2868]|uniref:hypothetical protein n=1 Tax=Pontibacter sp. MBLB2868 TaxID=3451555 RepID=UPI003F74E281